MKQFYLIYFSFFFIPTFTFNQEIMEFFEPTYYSIIINTKPITLHKGSFLDNFNSTTQPLAKNETFVGTTIEAINSLSITISFKVVPTLASGTLYLEFSPDGIHWDISTEHAIRNSDTGTTFTISPPPYKYFRLRYQNGPIAQTEFRLQTIHRY